MENNKYDVCGFNKEDALNELHQEKSLYQQAFYDIVQNYIECLNEDVEDNKEKLTLTETEKDKVVDRLIYDNDYLWGEIHESVDYEIGRVLRDRKEV